MEPTQLKSDDNYIIAEILRGNDACLNELYRLHRNTFVNMVWRDFGANEEQAKDAFQEAMIAFHHNICSKKLTVLTCTVRSYLFRLGIHKILNLQKKEQRLTYDIDLQLIQGKEHEDFMNEDRLETIQEQIGKALEKLPEDCRKVLKLYYYHGYDMDSIAREMGYKNADTAKSKKSLSMKKLLNELKKMTLLLLL